ncbi:hypothetical protein HK104_001482 [Borealophlyctis nickersoniae]|nr:hypothetical protein HK104_001482 [Borealophlyctis nickersoniae]
MLTAPSPTPPLTPNSPNVAAAQQEQLNTHVLAFVDAVKRSRALPAARLPSEVGAYLETCVNTARVNPSSFARSFARPFIKSDGHGTRIAVGVSGSEPTVRLAAALVTVLREADCASNYGDAAELLGYLSRHQSARHCILPELSSAVEIMSARLHASEKLEQALSALIDLTSTLDASLTRAYGTIWSFLRHRFRADAIPDATTLALFANLCKSTDFRNELKANPEVSHVYRTLIKILSERDFSLVTHSLRILVHLVVDDPVGQILFNDANVGETWKLLFSMMAKGAAVHRCHEAVMDLLDRMLAHERLRKGMERLGDLQGFLRVVLSKLLGNRATYPQFLTIFLNHGTSVDTLEDEIEKLGIIPTAGKYIKDGLQNDDGGGGSEGLHHACEFLKTLATRSHENAGNAAVGSQLRSTAIGLIKAVLISFGEDAPCSLYCMAQADIMDVLEASEAASEVDINSKDVDGLFNHIQTGASDEKAGIEEIEITVSLLRILWIFLEQQGADIPVEAAAADDDLQARLGGLHGLFQFLNNMTVRKSVARVLRASRNHFALRCATELCAEYDGAHLMIVRLIADVASVDCTGEASVLQKVREEFVGRPSDGNTPHGQPRAAEYQAIDSTLANADMELVNHSISQLKILEEELALAREHMQKELDLNISIFDRKVSAYERKITETTKLKVGVLVAAELHANISQMDRERTWQKEELQRNAMVLKDTQTKLTTAEASVKEGAETNAKLSHSLEETRERLAVAEGKVEKLERDLAKALKREKAREEEVQQEAEKLKETVQSLMSQRATLQAAREAEAARVAELESRIEELEEELGDQERDHEEIVAKLAQSLSTLNTLSTRKKKKAGTGGRNGTPNGTSEIGDVLGDLERRFKGAHLQP